MYSNIKDVTLVIHLKMCRNRYMAQIELIEVRNRMNVLQACDLTTKPYLKSELKELTERYHHLLKQVEYFTEKINVAYVEDCGYNQHSGLKQEYHNKEVEAHCENI